MISLKIMVDFRYIIRLLITHIYIYIIIFFSLGAWLLGAIMYAWQFPHFNALSWNLRQDYSRAGYRMTSVVDPELCKRVALRYSVGMIGLCTLAPALDVTTWTFAVDSLPLNVYLTYLAWKFYKQGDSNTSRKLFRFTLIHLPALLVLMIISKKTYGDKNKKIPSGIIAESETAQVNLTPATGDKVLIHQNAPVNALTVNKS